MILSDVKLLKEEIENGQRLDEDRKVFELCCLALCLGKENKKLRKVIKNETWAAEL